MRPAKETWTLNRPAPVSRLVHCSRTAVQARMDKLATMRTIAGEEDQETHHLSMQCKQARDSTGQLGILE